jgi:cytochrome P450 family 110
MARPDLPAGPSLTPIHSWLFINQPKRYYAWLRRRYGEAVTLKTPWGAVVTALTTEGARQVLSTHPDTYGAFQKEAFTGLTGLGSLWVLDGARHQQERTLLSSRFSSHHCRGFGHDIQKITRRHTDSWKPGQPINAYEVMLDISLDVILRVIFGTDRGGLIDDGRRALKTLLHVAHPLIAFLPIFQRWWFPPWWRYRRAKREFAAFVTRCLAERRARNEDSQDVLAIMLSARRPDGSSMSDDEINDELITILLAGHETTAVALAWALYEVGRHSAVLARLREELQALGPELEPDLIVKQPYLGAICDETLRLHPILTEVARTIRLPCDLLGYRLPAGLAVAVGISAIHQDPSLYPEPDEFRPDRFIEVRHNIGTGPKQGVRMRMTGRLSHRNWADAGGTHAGDGAP